MKATIILALACMAIGVSEAISPYGGFLGDPHIENPEKPPANVATEWYDQQLDHFNNNDVRTWKQRFFIRSTEFDGTGPVFLFIGGEGTLSPHWLSVGSMADLGVASNALMFGLEHRFYGMSQPTGDTSRASLAYLSSELALADLAEFRQSMARRFKLTEKNKWITFGGSYPGALSGWFRYKYPHLVYGAVASSAPIKATLNFKEYFEVATQALPEACRSAVQTATTSIENHIKTAGGRQHLSHLFKTCSPLTSDQDDLRMFTGTLNDNFFGAVQYDRANRASPILKRVNIAQVCDLMTRESIGDEVARYAAVNKLFKGEQCFDASYRNYVNWMRKTTTGNAMRQWTWQTCTEFGYFQTSDSQEQVFGSNTPLDFYLKQCLDIYGVSVKRTKREIVWANTEYGEYQLAKTGATRIIFPNGSVDPWHALSYLKSEENIVAIFIQGTSHCANMYSKSSKDPKQLVEARDKIDNIIKGWLAE